MLLKEIPRFDDLDLFPILENADKFCSPILVPIVEVKDLGIYKLQLDDLLSFSENNSILDLGQSLSIICSENQVDPNKICFMVNEENLLLNENLKNFVKSMVENNLTVAIALDTDILNETNIDYRHGELTDDPRSDNLRMKLISDDIYSTLMQTINSKNTPEDREALNTKKGITKMFDIDIARQAANRHFVKGKGVEYTGDMIGPQGQTLGFNAKSFKNMRETIKKMSSEIEKEKHKNLDDYKDPETYTDRDRRVHAFRKYGAKYLGPLLIKIMHIIVDQAENGVIQQEHKIRDLKRTIEEMDIPKNFLSRLIARLRSLYFKFMTKFNLNVYDREISTQNSQLIARTMANGVQLLNKDFFTSGNFRDKVEKLKPVLKDAGKLGLNVVKMKLITIAGRIANVIDVLLRHLQKAADKLSS